MAVKGEKTVYIYNTNLIRECNRLPSILNRASVVQDLINSYNLLSQDKFLVVHSSDATEEELKLFHTSRYIDFLKKVNDVDRFDQYEEEQSEYGLGYDNCPLLKNNLDLIKAIAGGSISGAKLLAANICKVAINWFGGWHHAQRNSAEGFCYVNDAVLAIEVLKRTFKKILYLDLDIHHGNGVQNAFEVTNRVLTLSFHKKSRGFYPESGDITDIGTDNGKYYSLNIPLLENVNDKTYLRIFNKIFDRVMLVYRPNAIVVQCGADGLNGDPLGECNLTLKGLGACVEKVMHHNLPTLFLGGGGYNFPNTARLWSYLTSVITGISLDSDIPDTSQYFTEYKPTYELHIEESLVNDRNTDDHINTIIDKINAYLDYIV